MRSSLFAVGVFLGIASGCCCHHHTKDTAECWESQPITASDMGNLQELVNSARIHPLLPPVQEAFRHDYPDVAVTGIRTYMSETGILLSEITFMDESGLHRVVYAPDGTPVPLYDMPDREATDPKPTNPSDAPPPAPPAEAPGTSQRVPAKKA